MCMRKLFTSAFLFVLSLILVACGRDTPTPVPKPQLDSAKQVAFYNNATLSQLVSYYDSLTYKAADYQVTIYKITYHTTLEDGSPTIASGIVYVPSQLTSATRAYPILSYQHPTAFSDAEAPSGTNFTIPTFSYQLYFATHGYIIACPDYIGYGVTDNLLHRYEHRQTLAQVTADMLLATKDFLAQQKINYSPQIFLAGYSEGGYASLAAQKMIEENYAGTLPLAGSSCGAGPYAMSAFFNHVTHQPTIGGIANYLYAWQVMTYNRIYKLNQPVSYYFKAPYAQQIEQSLENARQITASFDQICTNQFRTDVLDPSSPFGKALADDDLTDWMTTTPTLLVHSEQDEIIPFLTSQTTYAALRNRGSANLQIAALKKGYHIPTEVIFMSRSLAWFEQLRRK